MRTARRLLRACLLSVVVVGVIAPASTAVASPGKTIQQQIDDASNALEKIVEQYDGVNQKLHDNQATEAKLQTKIAPLLAASQAAHVKVGQIAASAYMTGPIGALGALVSSGDTSDMLNQLGTLNIVAAAQQRQIQAYEQTTAQYNTEKLRLDNLIAAENTLRKSLAAQKSTIKAKLAKLYAMRAAAYGSATVSGSGSHPAPPYLPGRGGKVVAFAYAQLGKPYVWAAAGPNSYDCSGLVVAAYRSVGVTLPHQSHEQWDTVHHISRSELSPGDLVFYESSSLHHVAIYIGGGKVIHAPTFGDVVKISSVTMMSAWGYGRV